MQFLNKNYLILQMKYLGADYMESFVYGIFARATNSYVFI
jgi:hypothetical protein